MNRSLFLGLLALATTAVTTFGQGVIYLDNYDSLAHPLVTYGPGSGGTVGAPIPASADFSVGLYYVNTAGNFVSSFNADPTGTALPTSLYTGSTGSLVLGTGAGSTAQIGSPYGVSDAGLYAANYFNPGIAAGEPVTLMLIAYNDGSYANATVRGHSTAFTMVGYTPTAIVSLSGDAETDGGFAVYPVPEPSVFALAAIGIAALMLTRRKK